MKQSWFEHASDGKAYSAGCGNERIGNPSVLFAARHRRGGRRVGIERRAGAVAAVADWSRSGSARGERVPNVPGPAKLPETEPSEFNFVRAVGGGSSWRDDLPPKTGGTDGGATVIPNETHLVDCSRDGGAGDSRRGLLHENGACA